MRRDQLRHHIPAFLAWLTDYGAEIGRQTNPYEVVRYRAYWRASRKASTHIIYAKDNGLLTWTGASIEHFRAFLADERPGDSMRVAPKEPLAVPGFPPEPVEAVSISARQRKRLRERDGDECWFCGLPMGDDCTLEHLVPKSKGGSNALDNFALAHAKCNHAAADKPLVEKIAMRLQLRGVAA